MEKIQKDMIALLKSRIENTECVLSKNPDWQAILKLSKKAQILPIIYDAIKYAKYTIPNQLDQEYMQYFIMCANVDANQDYHIQRLIDAFNENCIDFSLLKGASIKKLYGNTFFRCMGDIDILIRTEQYDKIKKIMLGLQYTQQQETIHELIWTKAPFICIELHKMLIPEYNKDFFAYYGNGWGKMNKYNEYMYKMKSEDEFIYLFTHFAKHYRDGGIGIRHLMDLRVFMKNYTLNKRYIIDELKVLHLDKFYKNIIDTINVWFCDGEETPETIIITNTIFQSGSYGNSEKFDYANALRTSRKYSSTFAARMAYVAKLIFLPLPSMKKKYPVLNKYSCLLPLFWCIRWIDVLIHSKNRIKVQSDRAKKICEKDVNSYESELEAVGLNYYF